MRTNHKKKKVKLLPHEAALLKSGQLMDVTHAGASSTWLNAPSGQPAKGRVICYRHMGDKEFAFLLERNQLPETQPYQTLTRGEEGRAYCEKYFRSNEFVDTLPTTVVEFECEEEMVERFFGIQSKIEDGTISHGLGSKAGNTVAEFNRYLAQTRIRWRIVLVKRNAEKG